MITRPPATLRPTEAHVRGAMDTARKPMTADDVMELVLREHWQVEGSTEWTTQHVSHVLLSMVCAGAVVRVGHKHSKLAGRQVPLYTQPSGDRDWQVRALETAANRVGGDLAVQLLQIRDQLG